VNGVRTVLMEYRNTGEVSRVYEFGLHRQGGDVAAIMRSIYCHKNFAYKNFSEFGSLCEPLQAGLSPRTMTGYCVEARADYRPVS
jgi:hypothetical protein